MEENDSTIDLLLQTLSKKDKEIASLKEHRLM